jgi:large subunit ribosomal protein L9
MDVVLLERIESLGQMGQVVSVKNGFARNYLLPQGKAQRATAENLAQFEARRGEFEARNLEQRTEAEGVANAMPETMIVVIRQAGETGQLYGSVAARDVVEGLDAVGFKIARSQVALPRPIKTLGLHPVRVSLHPEVHIEVIANVARSEAEAERQAAGEDPLAEEADDFDGDQDADDLAATGEAEVEDASEASEDTATETGTAASEDDA